MNLGIQKKNCFQIDLWKESGLCTSENGTVMLEEIIRQKDPIFIGILNEIRRGHLSVNASKVLNACHVGVKAIPDDRILPTKLYCFNKDVDAENFKNLEALTTESHKFNAVDEWIQPASS